MLKRWSFQSSAFRRETVDRIDWIFDFVRQFVDAKLPGYDPSERDALASLGRQRVFTSIVAKALDGLPTRVEGRRYWTSAVAEAPRSRPTKTHRDVFVDWEVGRQFADRFSFPRSLREMRSSDPALTALGYLLESYGRDDLHRLVDDVLARLPELQEVVASASSSSPSPSSS